MTDPSQIVSIESRYKQYWDTHGECDLATFLKDSSVSTDDELFQLVVVDQQLWGDAGKVRRTEEYRDTFPDLFESPERLGALALQEFRLLQQLNLVASVPEFVGRFPSIADSLRAELEAQHPGADKVVVDETMSFAPDSSQQNDPPLERTTSFAGNMPPSTVPKIGDFKSSPAAELDRFGEYENLQFLARGGMGVVYKAHHAKLNRTVALKMILGSDFADDEQVKRFQTEAAAAARLDHPGIVPVYEFGEANGRHYYSMGFVDGQTLADRLRDRPMTSQASARMLREIALAVGYAHSQRVVHRDLKPGNVLIDKENRPRVTDFGLAKLIEHTDSPTATGDILGTPSYMPPEQATGDVSRIGPLSDIYSLGAIGYAMAAGRPPFQAANPLETLRQVVEKDIAPPRDLNPDVDFDLQTILLKCLSKEPERRYATAIDLADDLQRFIEGKPIVARPVGFAERSWRWTRRNPVIASLAAAIMIALLLVVGVSTFAAVTVSETNNQLQTEVGAKEDALIKLAAEKKVVDRKQREVEHQNTAILKQKDEIDAKRKEADTERAEAETQRNVAQDERDAAQQSLFVMQIALARFEWEAGNADRAEEILNACQPSLRGWEWRHLKYLCNSEMFRDARSVTSIDQHPEKPLVVGYGHPDKEGKTNSIMLWDTLKGEQLFAKPSTESNPLFTPDGEQIIVVSNQRAGGVLSGFEGVIGPAPTNAPKLKCNIAVLNLNGEELRSFDIETLVGDVRVTYVPSADGSDESVAVLQAMHVDGELREYDFETGALRGSRTLFPNCYARLPNLTRTGFRHGFRLSPDGRRAIVVLGAGNILVADTQPDSAIEIPPVEIDQFDVVEGRDRIGWHHVEFSADGSRFAVAGSALNEVRVYELPLGPVRPARPRWAFPFNHDHVGCLSFGAGGRLLGAGADANAAMIWDLNAGQIHRQLRGHRGEMGVVSGMAFSPGALQMTTAGVDGLKVWNITHPQEFLNMPRNAGMVGDLAFSPDGRFLASAGHQALGQLTVFMNVYNVESGAVDFIDGSHRRDVHAVAWMKDSKRLASGGDEGVVRIWRLLDGKTQIQLRAAGTVTDIETHPAFPKAEREGALEHDVVAALSGKRLFLWNVPSTGEDAVEVADIEFPGTPKDVKFIPGQQFVKVACVELSSDRKDVAIKVYKIDAVSGKQIDVWSCPTPAPGNVVLSQDGKFLANSVSTVNRVQPDAEESKPATTPNVPRTHIYVWNTETGKLLQDITPPIGRSDIVAMTFTPDSGRLAYTGGARDRFITMFDVQTGRATITLRNFSQSIHAMAFDSHSNRFAAGGLLDYVRVYAAMNPEEIEKSRPARRQQLKDTEVSFHRFELVGAMGVRDRRAAYFHMKHLDALKQPRDPRLDGMRIELLCEAGHWREAAEAIERRPTAGKPLMYEYMHALALLHENRHSDYQELCERLRRNSTGYKPPDATSFIWICCLAPNAMQDYDVALSFSDRILALSPKFYGTAYPRAALFYRMGKRKEAKAEFERAIELHGKGGQPYEWLFLSMIESKDGNPQLASEWLTKFEKHRNALDPYVPFSQQSVQQPTWNKHAEWGLLESEARYELSRAQSPDEPPEPSSDN